MPANDARVYYGLIINFDSTIAAGASDEKSSKIDGAYDFVVEAMQMTIWTPTASGTSIAGTPFARWADASPPAAVGNIWPTLDHFRVQLRINDETLFRVPVRASLIAGNGAGVHYPLTKIIARRGQTVFASVLNDTPANTCQAQLLLEGYYAKPGGRN